MKTGFQSSIQEKVDVITAVLAEQVEPAEVRLLARPSDGDSDILLAVTPAGALCMGCALVADGRGTYQGVKPSDVAGHVRRHKSAKHAVPADLELHVATRWMAPK